MFRSQNPRFLLGDSSAGPHDDVLTIDKDESLASIIRKLSECIVKIVTDTPYSFEQMRTSPIGNHLKILADKLVATVHNERIIAAFMVMKYQFSSKGADDLGLNESRGYACEFVAWQFAANLSSRETIEYLLNELPSSIRPFRDEFDPEEGISIGGSRIHKPYVDEGRPLLARASLSVANFFRLGATADEYFQQGDLYEEIDENSVSQFLGLNALEIAVVAEAKKFLSQKAIQRIINDLWHGNIVLWDNLSLHAKKKPQLFNERTSDPYSRLRIPVYRKAFEALFFLSFLAIYYTVLMERNPFHISFFESLMYIWIAAFAYDAFGGISDAGVMFYQMDFWSVWDLFIIVTGATFLITRIIGLSRQDDYIVDLSFDILSLEALFLLPRICSLGSLNPYFGSLIPVLKEMTKAFLRFLPIVVVLYLGFLTTFTLLARDRLSLKQTTFLLIKIFFGSSALGFDISREISPIFGYPLMLLFVCLTNILLISSVISLMSLSLTEIMTRAREEYLFQLSVYVLESSTSRRLTYFMPPMNLVPLFCVRPLRLFLSSGAVRRVRIAMLRATHFPCVAIILFYEYGLRYVQSWSYNKTYLAARHGLRPRTIGSYSGPEMNPPSPVPLEENRRQTSPQSAYPTSDVNTAHLTDIAGAVNDMREQINHLAIVIERYQQTSLTHSYGQ